MKNAMALPAKLPNGLTPPLTASLGSQDLAKHRAMIALEQDVLAVKFNVYGWDKDSPARDRTITDWMDALQDYPLDEVKAACRSHVVANPGKMPNEGHILAQIMAARAKVVASLPKPPEPEAPPRVSREQAAEIMAKYGVPVKRMGART